MKKKLFFAVTILICTVFMLSGCLDGAGSGKVNTGKIDAPAIAVPDSSNSDTGELPQTSPPETEPPIQTEVTFLAAGDNVIHKGIYGTAKRNAYEGGREYNFRPMYEDVEEFISSFDLAFINQEVMMGGAELGYSDYPLFNCPQDLGYDLIDVGFDIINIATNHMVDKGAVGLSNTIDFLNTLPATIIGGYKNEADFNDIRVIECNQIKIALLSYTYGTNGLSLPSSSELYVPYINDADIIAQTSKAHELADVIVVSVHWGDENTFAPNAEQRRVAQLMADNGVDVIIGHHPHTLQPIEWIESDTGNRTLCIFSLGNLLSMMPKDYNMVGGFFTFKIIRDGDDFYVDCPEFYPTVFYYAMNWRSNKVYFLNDFTEALAASHGIGNYGNSMTVSKLYSYVKKAISDKYLPEYMV